MAMSYKQAARTLRAAGFSDAEIIDRLGAPGKGNKYNAKRTYSDRLSHNFHSAAECRYAEHLLDRQDRGEIEGLELQRREKLLGVVTMIVDFFYIEDGQPVWNEYKGFATDRWRLQRGIWAQVGPGEYRVTREAKRDPIHPYRHTRIFPRPNAALHNELVRLLQAETTRRTDRA